MRRIPYIFQHRLSIVLLSLALSVTASSMPLTQAATSDSTVIAAYIPSSTNISATGCATGQVDRTDFGTVLAGTMAVTGLSCTIQFGSSNDVARLRMAQTDGRGVGMYQPTRGALDAGFGAAGKVLTATGPGTRTDYAIDSVVQSDGRIVTAGACDMGAATGFDICVARYLTTGALDTTFDGDGRATTAVGPGSRTDFGEAIALQPDGRIVVAGYCDMGATSYDLCVVRYNSNGSLDTSFDTDGRVTTNVAAGSSLDIVFDMALQPDGKIVTAGFCAMGGATGQDACLARYNPDGSLDASFDGDGRVTTATAPGAGDDTAFSIAVQADGRIVTAGSCNMGGGTGSDICLSRYDSTGALDTSFDADGRVTTPIAPGTGEDVAYAIEVQPDARLIAAGACQMGGATGQDSCIARYNANGSLDTSFDVDGKVTTAAALGAGAEDTEAVHLMPDGRFITAGACYVGATTGIDLCLSRYRTDGSLDVTFDGDGIASTAIAPGSADDHGYNILSAGDGRIVVAGWCTTAASGIDACLAQYDTAGTFSQYVDTTTDWDTPGTSHFGACMTSVTSGSSNWTTSATCPMTDGAYWNAIPTAATQIATATANTTNATANLRFGIRAASSQPPGSYMAPVSFDVIAP